MDAELPFYVGFSVFPGIGPVRFRLLLEYFGSAKSAYNASQKDLLVTGLGDKLTQEFLKFRQSFSFDAYWKLLEKRQIQVIIDTDPSYPKNLKSIPDNPFMLYVYGSSSLELLNHPRLVGVVGTRMVTAYGHEVTVRITQDLARLGFVVVSGMAFGVDALAHKGALDAGGQTIAVLGCGVDVIAPSSNANLYYDIAKNNHGLVVSEMPLGHRPGKGLFPARNRIISGLCKGIVVTEGAVDSGSLITARYAAEQGREVCAVPGPISNIYSHGPAKLIKNGATLVESAEDVCDALGFAKNQLHVTKPQGLDPNEGKLVDLLTQSPLEGNTLVQAMNMPAKDVFSLLTKLELGGVIQRIGDAFALA